MLKTLLTLAAGAAMGALAALPGAAQTFPSRPITLVVPFAAGGPSDAIGRLVAQSMSQTLGQQVIVENVAGAGGTTGAAGFTRLYVWNWTRYWGDDDPRRVIAVVRQCATRRDRLRR